MVTQAQSCLFAAERILPFVALPSQASQPPLGAAGPTLATTQPRTRTLDDPDVANTEHRRLRPRTDAGPRPPKNGSPIEVDTVISPVPLCSPVHCSALPSGHLTPTPFCSPFLLSTNHFLPFVCMFIFEIPCLCTTSPLPPFRRVVCRRPS